MFYHIKRKFDSNVISILNVTTFHVVELVVESIHYTQARRAQIMYKALFSIEL